MPTLDTRRVGDRGRPAATTPVAARPSCSPRAGYVWGLASRPVSTLKEHLRADLTAAMKARDELVKSTLRMTLTAVRNVEVAGTEAREIDDAEVLR